eukprot:TRINITY_DN35376_c0_g2_i1.p1 TRINITY_DN35376_c0_g2~~TRINITY_DN35376_c0_g2_i1.p1  ORF type:complete len:341 (+),score=87.85 TRINITY_DN35376_c0_g2_i1:90-1025(+)
MAGQQPPPPVRSWAAVAATGLQPAAPPPATAPPPAAAPPAPPPGAGACRGGYTGARSVPKDQVYSSNLSIAEQAALILEEQLQEEQSLPCSEEEEEEAAFLMQLGEEASSAAGRTVQQSGSADAGLETTCPQADTPERRNSPRGAARPRSPPRLQPPVLKVEVCGPPQQPSGTPSHAAVSLAEFNLLTPAMPPSRQCSASALGFQRGRSSVVYEPLERVSTARERFEQLSQREGASDMLHSCASSRAASRRTSAVDVALRSPEQSAAPQQAPVSPAAPQLAAQRDPSAPQIARAAGSTTSSAGRSPPPGAG